MDTYDDNIEQRTPSVETLSSLSFLIPSYQRGYRWTPGEVKELLEDISRFAAEGNGRAEDFYCLQPLVVRRRDDDQWEVIDGQQRLTTVYLITRYMNEMWSGRTKDTELTLDYESRERTQAFLKELAVAEDGSVTFTDENIDFAYISKAYQTIAEWADGLGANLDRYKFMSVFRHRVRVIWYEPEGKDPVAIFTRINRGKIPLTNAELIRGLFLKSSNFAKADAAPGEAEAARLGQMEISGDWDRIEAALHDDKLWYFLAGPKDLSETRIDLIFRILTGVYDDDGYGLFRAYAETLPAESDPASVLEKWTEIKECFQQLEDWYLDWELYHWIGYLIAVNEVSLSTLWKESRDVRRSVFKAKLKDWIKNTVSVEKLDALAYGNAEVPKVLLLHNILTVLKSRERQYRFPFNRYKTQKWDVEHIHSVAEKEPENEFHQREWLKDAVEYLPENNDLKNGITTFLKREKWTDEEFEALYHNVLKAFSETGEPESINDLSNLALLDSRTNRGYGNAVFPAKRAKIIECEGQGIFVPLATKNAFMKFYSKSTHEFTFWSRNDREQYFDAMRETIETFFSRNEGTTS